TASFKLRLGDGSAQAADGFSFNFADNLPNAAGSGENGLGTGFSFAVDNFQFSPIAVGNVATAPGGGTAFTSGMKIQYNNIILAGVPIPTWNDPRFIPVSITVGNDGAL